MKTPRWLAGQNARGLKSDSSLYCVFAQDANAIAYQEEANMMTDDTYGRENEQQNTEAERKRNAEFKGVLENNLEVGRLLMKFKTAVDAYHDKRLDRGAKDIMMFLLSYMLDTGRQYVSISIQEFCFEMQVKPKTIMNRLSQLRVLSYVSIRYPDGCNRQDGFYDIAISWIKAEHISKALRNILAANEMRGKLPIGAVEFPIDNNSHSPTHGNEIGAFPHTREQGNSHSPRYGNENSPELPVNTGFSSSSSPTHGNEVEIPDGFARHSTSLTTISFGSSKSYGNKKKAECAGKVKCDVKIETYGAIVSKPYSSPSNFTGKDELTDGLVRHAFEVFCDTVSAYPKMAHPAQLSLDRKESIGSALREHSLDGWYRFVGAITRSKCLQNEKPANNGKMANLDLVKVIRNRDYFIDIMENKLAEKPETKVEKVSEFLTNDERREVALIYDTAAKEVGFPPVHRIVSIDDAKAVREILDVYGMKGLCEAIGNIKHSEWWAGRKVSKRSGETAVLRFSQFIEPKIFMELLRNDGRKGKPPSVFGDRLVPRSAAEVAANWYADNTSKFIDRLHTHKSAPCLVYERTLDERRQRLVFDSQRPEGQQVLFDDRTPDGCGFGPWEDAS